jgi:hypothetical protein
MSRQHDCWKRNNLIYNIWLSEVYKCWSTHMLLEDLQSFSHVPCVHKANLTRAWWYDDATEFQGGEKMPWSLSRLHQLSRTLLRILPNLSSQPRLVWGKIREVFAHLEKVFWHIQSALTCGKKILWCYGCAFIAYDCMFVMGKFLLNLTPVSNIIRFIYYF